MGSEGLKNYGTTVLITNDVEQFQVPSGDDLLSTDANTHTFPTKVIAFCLGAVALIAGLSSYHSDSNVPVPMLGISKESSLDLPDYLVSLDESDEDWDNLKGQLTSSWVIGEEGKGNLIPDKVEIVEFVKDHYVFRAYGGEGKANQCGYWWVLNPPTGDTVTYFDHFAICNAWNDATDIIRCRVPQGYKSAVGIGQSVDCPSGNHLAPLDTILQLNGNICQAAVPVESHLSCEYCSSEYYNLENSECSNKGASYIDGFDFNVGNR
jgi:hypothetical protein